MIIIALQIITKWSSENDLKLNVDKCSVLHLAPQNLVQVLSVEGVSVSLGGQVLAV